MSDVGPYGTHQHASPHAVRAHTFVGEPAGHVTVDAAVVGASPATFSTAPFKGAPKLRGQPKPRRRRVNSEGVPLCAANNDTCNTWALKDSIYCRHHDPRRAK